MSSFQQAQAADNNVHYWSDNDIFLSLGLGLEFHGDDPVAIKKIIARLTHKTYRAEDIEVVKKLHMLKNRPDVVDKCRELCAQFLEDNIFEPAEGLLVAQA